MSTVKVIVHFPHKGGYIEVYCEYSQEMWAAAQKDSVVAQCIVADLEKTRNIYIEKNAGQRHE